MPVIIGHLLNGRLAGLSGVTLLKDLKWNAPEVALVYVGFGDKDHAMAWLEKAFTERFNPGVLLRPSFDPLCSDRRFQNVVRRIGLAR